MSVLLDSNILTRLAQHTHPMHATARDAVAALRQGGDTLFIVPQNLYEFWVVATRPIAANGLGLTAAEADAELAASKRSSHCSRKRPPSSPSGGVSLSHTVSSARTPMTHGSWLPCLFMA